MRNVLVYEISSFFSFFSLTALTFTMSSAHLLDPTVNHLDAVGNEDISDLSTCHKEFSVVFVPRGQRLKPCMLRKKR